MSAAMDDGYARIASELLAARRARDALFGSDSDGFGEPGWDMLLALFVQGASGKPTSIANLLDAGAVRTKSIAERYLEWMISRDLAQRNGDDVAISARGRTLMMTYLDSAAGLSS